MGQAQTAQQKVNTAQSTIENLHVDVKRLEQIINQEVAKLERDISNANYTNLEELCDQIGYQYVDRLSAHFPITTLEGYGRIKLGLEPKPTTEGMENYKQSVCKNIVAFYKKKLFLLEQIKKETPKCQVQEKTVFDNLSEKLRKEGIDTEQWMDVYKKVQQFNKDIKYQYSKIGNSVQKIRDAQNWAQLNSASKDTIELLNNTNTICTRYQSDLNRFATTIETTALSAPITSAELPTEISSSAPVSAPVSVATPVPASIAPVPVEVKKESTESSAPISVGDSVPVGATAVLTEDFTYKGDVTPKGTQVKVSAYDNKGWAKVELSDGKVKFVAKRILARFSK